MSKYPNDFELIRNKTNIVCEKMKKLKALVQSNGSKYLTKNMNCYI